RSAHPRGHPRSGGVDPPGRGPPQARPRHGRRPGRAARRRGAGPGPGACDEKGRLRRHRQRPGAAEHGPAAGQTPDGRGRLGARRPPRRSDGAGMSADGGGGGGGARKGPRRGAGGNRSQGQGQGRGRGGGPHGKGRGGGRPRSDRERGFGAGPGTGRHRGSGKPRGGRERTVDPARTVARDVLRAVREREAYANLLLPKLLADRGISGRDAAFATELTYGAARELGLLDAVIAAAADRPVGDIDPEILDDLRLGAYQLLRTRVPAHAALSTTVDLVAADAGRGASGFANAVLRRVTGASAEEWIDRLTPDAAAGPVAALAFAHSHPEWIAQAFADALGADAGQLSDALAADNIAPQVHLVARPGEISAEELALITGGEPGTYSPYAVHLDGGDPGRLEPVRERLAAVQDEGSQLIALATYRAPVT